jgi:parallel beta-helix repeat protein
MPVTCAAGVPQGCAAAYNASMRLAIAAALSLTILASDTGCADGGTGAPEERSVSGRRYVVDSAHAAADDGNPGTPERPLRTIGRAAALAAAGDLVLIRPGEYREQVVVARAGTPTEPIVFQAARRGSVVLSGSTTTVRPAGWKGDDDNSGTSGPGYVTLRGLVFRETDRFAVRAGVGWRIEDCRFERTPNGINIRGHEVAVVRSTFLGSGTHAIVASGGRDIRIADVEIRGSNTSRADPAHSAVTKFLFTHGLVVERLTSTDNVGPGLWLDGANRHFTIRDSVLARNRGRDAAWQGPGIWIEISDGPGVIEGNVIDGNQGSGIGILESENVVIRDNLLVDNGACLELRNMKRPPYEVRNVSVTGNRCKAWRGNAVQTSIGDWSGWSAAGHGIVIDGNLYDPLPGRNFFAWLGVRYRSLDAVRTGLGFEQDGRVAQIAGP